MKTYLNRCAVLLTVSAMACSCGGRSVTHTTTIPVAARTMVRDAPLEELLERYNAYARGVQTVNATMELKPTAGSKYSGVIDEYHEVKAFLLASRPQSIRVIGQVPVVGKTIFDMASDGQIFEVSIPPRNKFLTGSVAVERVSAKPIENLRPQHLLEALLWPEIRGEEAVLLEEFNDETARYYVLTVLRGGYKTEILRKVWFDRADLSVARLAAYGPKGALLSDVRYSDWQPVAPASNSPSGSSAMEKVTAFPRSIRIDRPHDDYHLDLAVSKIALNQAFEPDRFKISPPPGAELVLVDNATNESKKP